MEPRRRVDILITLGHLLMDGQTSRQSADRTHWLARDLPWLIGLLAIVVVLRLWLLVNTEVTARDSIGFIRYALQLDRLGWSEVVRSQHQHPGYPIVVWVVSQPIRSIWGTTPETMRIAAQLVSILSSLALAFVMFRLGSMLWDRFVGFFAALLFQWFPISGHHLSDGISDGLFLTMAMSSLYLLIRARESGSILRYALSGAFIGLAYLTRPEGMLILPAAWLFCVGLQFTRDYWITWRQAAIGLCALTFSCIAAGSPYYLATGKLTMKPVASQMINQAKAAPAKDAPEIHSGGPLFASIFAANFHRADTVREQLYRSLRALVLELCQALNYVGAGVALWGLIFGRKMLTRHPGFYLLAIYFVCHASVLVYLGLTASYVSDRHVMVLVAMACYVCVIGMLHANQAWIRWTGSEAAPAAGYLQPRIVLFGAAFWLALSLVACGGKTVTRLHSNRVGNHEAGLWLAKQTVPGDFIEDDHGWSHYYAGHLFLEKNEPAVPPEVKPNHFIVMTRSRDDEVREKREQIEADLKRKDASLVYHWPTNVSPDKARIVVYARPRTYATHPWPVLEGGPAFHSVSRSK